MNELSQLDKRIIKNLLKANNETIAKLFFDWANKLIDKLSLSSSDPKLAITCLKDGVKLFSINLNSRLLLRLNKSSIHICIKKVDLEKLPSSIFDEMQDFDKQDPLATLFEISFENFLNYQDLLYDLWMEHAVHYYPMQNTSQFRIHHAYELYNISTDENLLNTYLKHSDKNQILINNYKQLIRNKGLNDEIYKWELIQQFQHKPDLDSENFEEEIKSINYSNLVYQGCIMVRNKLAEHKTEEYKQAFGVLFDESQDLQLRLNSFRDEIERLFSDLREVDGHGNHHDERSCSTFLTYKMPEIYSFYKASFYKKLCKYLGVPVRPSGERLVHYYQILNEFRQNYVLSDNELLELVDSQLNEHCYKDNNRTILTQDIYYQLFEKDKLKLLQESEVESNKNLNVKEMASHSLNQILYGPPGTGKTYETKRLAVEIIDGTAPEDRKELTQRYNELKAAGQIQFTTFHQSMSYEDFVEGIKPLIEKNNKGERKVVYDVQDGIFKNICIEANRQKSVENFENAYDSFIQKIADEGKSTLYSLVQNTPFDVKVNSNQNLIAIPHTEKATNMVITKTMIKEYVINNKIVDWKTYTTAIGKHLIENYNVQISDIDNRNNNYVLIIDEINRGNVSAIFGELITLLEDDKREGKDEAVEVVLPYSKETFSVPSNVYIIGTMNTADRSVEALDTALRRRFSFQEIGPNSQLLLNNHYEEVDLARMLDVINQRIELLIDKDHQIGHSYLMHVETIDDLKRVFKDKILPLLEEYFYGDFGKIGLVLGDRFVQHKASSTDNILAEFQAYDDASMLTDKKIYTYTKPIKNMDVTDFQSIYSVGDHG